MRVLFEKFVLILIVLLLSLTSAYAEGIKKETVIDEIVVTATRTEKTLESVPGSVSIVKKEDIENRNVLTVDQAMEALPGAVYRQHRSIMTTWPTITLRGIPGQRRTLVMMDGVPLNEPLNGGVRFAGYAPEDVERIELVRGPFSSLYGGYAMGGAVNIITKTPEKREIILKTGYGSSWESGKAPGAMNRVYLSYGDKYNDKVRLFLSYGYNAASDFPTDFNVQAARPPAGINGWSETRNQFGEVRYLIGDQGNNDWWDDKITVKTGIDFSKDSKLNFSFTRTCLEWDSFGDGAQTYLRDAAGNPVWSYGTVRESSFIMTPSMGSEINLYNLSYETKFSNTKAKLSFGLIDAEKRRHATHGATATRFGGPAVVSNSPSEGYISELLFTMPIFNRQILTYGGSFKHDLASITRHNLTNWRDKGSTTNMVYNTSGKANTYALFIQDEIMILDNLTAYLGLRHDWWTTFDGYDNDVGKPGYPINHASRSKTAFSPKAALVYKPFEKTSLKTSFGQAFRPPAIAELYGTFLRADLKTNAGNPDLKPETSTSWEIGIEQGLWKGAKAGVTYFENYLQDFVHNVEVTNTLLRWENAEKAEGKGIEVEAEQKFDKWLRLFANLTYNDIKVTENRSLPRTVGKKLTDVPEWMFNGGVDFKMGLFTASFIGRHKSKIYLNNENRDTENNVYNSYDAHFVADTKISYKVTQWATAAFSINNIFDNQYYIGPKAPGRSWFGEVTMKF